MALSPLIEISTEKDKVLINYFMEKIYNRLIEAQNPKNFESKDKLYMFQYLLCYCVHCLCINTTFNIINLDNQKIENYFDIIESFFKMRNGVFEEGFMALSSLITLVSNDQNEKLIERIMVYVLFSLNNYQDAGNCENACLCLINIIQAGKEKFIKYISNIYNLFNNIIKAEDANKNIFTLIIVVYSDLFGFIGEQIWNYYEDPMNFMNQLITFSVNNNEKYLNSKIDTEEYKYFIKLNEGLVDFISSAVAALTKENEEKKEKFQNYVPDILEYLSIMMGNQMFNPSNNYLRSCVDFLIDLADIYKKYIFKRINDYTLQRLFQLINYCNDDNLIHLRDYLQNLIFTIKRQN